MLGIRLRTSGGDTVRRHRAHNKVLVIGADVMSSIIDYTDRATCVIFGDGAGAVLLEPAADDSVGIIDFVHEIDGSGACLLHAGAEA
jgi:3-oxoacyl-[acyl-carrier-protein] synthase-3